ncbi:hypothetical protein E2562_028753 [Oryza meyeriana var. granulata]|uniref:Uncharacterized protein n=1 Tax=Oryza meyeriana var. granulata TaxID=110450 RepID=A0A6G1DAU3_9ORYZ|nr:hypothetical protein E2562_028753 [Oryza meyeriana var. granulata]
MAPPPRGRLVYSAMSLVLHTAFIAFYLLCATGRLRCVLGPRGAAGDDAPAAPPHVALAWKLVSWVAVLLWCVADAHFDRLLHRRRRLVDSRL